MSCATTAVGVAIYSSIAAYLWFAGGDVGRVFAMVQVAGGLLHVSLHMHHARPILISAVAPHGAYFLGLPVVTFILTPIGGGTNLRVEQAGFHPGQTQAYGGAKAGWQKFLRKLDDLLTRLV